MRFAGLVSGCCPQSLAPRTVRLRSRGVLTEEPERVMAESNGPFGNGTGLEHAQTHVQQAANIYRASVAFCDHESLLGARIAAISMVQGVGPHVQHDHRSASTEVVTR